MLLYLDSRSTEYAEVSSRLAGAKSCVSKTSALKRTHTHTLTHTYTYTYTHTYKHSHSHTHTNIVTYHKKC